MKNASTSVSLQRGFTMIELLIAVAIVGILAAIAIPSYSQYMERSRRSDAVIMLQKSAGEQIRFFSEYNRYATKMSELGYGNADTALSDEGFYTISVTNDSPTAFLLTATPVATGAQANDTECAAFTLSSSEVKGVSGTWSATPRKCW